MGKLLIIYIKWVIKYIQIALIFFFLLKVLLKVAHIPWPRKWSFLQVLKVISSSSYYGDHAIQALPIRGQLSQAQFFHTPQYLS